MRNKQHYIWLPGDRVTLCGKSANSRAISSEQWFPFYEMDCAVCKRAVLAHFWRQGRKDYYEVTGEEVRK